MADEPSPMHLTPSNILGIIQRSLSELNAYCNQHPSQVDPHVCMRYLEETGIWVGRMGAMGLPNGAGESPEKRAN